MTPALLNITGKDFDKNVTSLLNLAPIFITTPKSVPYMEIITAIESQALNTESRKMDISAEYLRQTVSKTLSKTIAKKQEENLNKTQRAALNQSENNKQIRVYSFDKAVEFTIMNNIDDISKN